jgi:hypothetical protein
MRNLRYGRDLSTTLLRFWSLYMTDWLTGKNSLSRKASSAQLKRQAGGHACPILLLKITSWSLLLLPYSKSTVPGCVVRHLKVFGLKGDGMAARPRFEQEVVAPFGIG